MEHSGIRDTTDISGVGASTIVLGALAPTTFRTDASMYRADNLSIHEALRADLKRGFASDTDRLASKFSDTHYCTTGGAFDRVILTELVSAVIAAKLWFSTTYGAVLCHA